MIYAGIYIAGNIRISENTRMKEYLTPFIFLLEEMAPYLLLGFFIAGLLHAFVPKNVYRKWLAGDDWKSVLLSVLFGVPLPLCSCGVVPTAVAMRKEGASRSATTAFLIATPQTGVDSIAATWSVFGAPFAILRPFAALIVGIFGGFLSGRLSKGGEGISCNAPEEGDERPAGFKAKCRSALEYGFTNMIQDIGKWLVIGLLLAGLITIFVPDDFFVTFAGGNALFNYLIVIAIAVPMYVCATGSIPVAAALMLKGLSPGAAFVFLMAGPATNIASILILSKTLGRKSLIAYLFSIITGAFLFAFLADFALPREWFTAKLMGTMKSCCSAGGHSEASLIQIISTIVLTFLLVRAFILKKKKTNSKAKMKKYIVKGMVCNHCKAHVAKAIRNLAEVENVEIKLDSGEMFVEGNVSADKIIKAVEEIGYECREA